MTVTRRPITNSLRQYQHPVVMPLSIREQDLRASLRKNGITSLLQATIHISPSLPMPTTTQYIAMSCPESQARDRRTLAAPFRFPCCDSSMYTISPFLSPGTKPMFDTITRLSTNRVASNIPHLVYTCTPSRSNPTLTSPFVNYSSVVYLPLALLFCHFLHMTPYHYYVRDPLYA